MLRVFKGMKNMINKYKTIKLLAERFSNKNISWAIIGSANLSLQGVEVNPLDIDIITDFAGFNTIVDLMQKNVDGLAEYVESGKIASYYVKLCINNIYIDVFSNIKNMIDGQYLDIHFDWQENVIIFNLSGFKVPVMSLIFERKVYKMIGDNCIVSKIDSKLYQKTLL